MSKEVEKRMDSKIDVNIIKELAKKQLIDCAILLIAFSLIFCCSCFGEFDKYDMLFLLMPLFLVVAFIFECTKNMVKRPLASLASHTYDKTIKEINEIKTRNNSQKENNILSEAKIVNIKEITENLKKYSTDMESLTNQTREKTDESLNFTNNEYGAVKSNIEKMFSIRHKIQTIAELILELSDFVQSISSTVGLVEDIAEQTNLLALNAAVEAARAGEHGKGFAVVASEIRKLADESKQATSKIIALINDIQQTANSTVLATEEGTKEIESGLELAHVISENIEKLIDIMNEISQNMKSIISASKQISADSNTSSNFLEEISDIIEAGKEFMNKNEDTFESIEKTSNKFKDSVI